MPDIARNIRPDNYGLSQKDLKDCVRAFYAAVSFVDAGGGGCLTLLTASGWRSRLDRVLE